jgi:hypothetical protein
MPLYKAFATALDLTGKVGRQRREAPAQLNLRPLPGREGSLRRFSRRDVVQGWIGMARIRIVLQLSEGSVLGVVVFS